MRPQSVNAPAEAARRYEKADNAHNEPRNDGKEIVLEHGGAVGVLHLLHAAVKAVHDAEGLYRPDIAERVLMERHDLTADILHTLVIFTHFAHKRP